MRRNSISVANGSRRVNVNECFSLEPQVRSIANNVRPDRQSEYYLLISLRYSFLNK